MPDLKRKRPNQRAVTIPADVWAALDDLPGDRSAHLVQAAREYLQRRNPPRIRAASGPTAPCSGCGRDLPVEGYCQAGPLCGECF